MFSIIPASETASSFPPCVRPWGVKPEGLGRTSSRIVSSGFTPCSARFTERLHRVHHDSASGECAAPGAARGGGWCGNALDMLTDGHGPGAGLPPGHLNLQGNYGFLPHYSGRTLGGRSSRRRASWVPVLQSVLGGGRRCASPGWGASISPCQAQLPIGAHG